MKKILVLLTVIFSLIGASEVLAGPYTPSRYSTSPSQISFTNNSSNNSISIYWVDYDGNERYYTTMSPRATYVQDTLIGHVWNVRNASNSTLLATITSNYSYQQNTITSGSNGTNTASPSYATSSSRIYFTNNSNVNVIVYWVDQNGNERTYRTLSPGESYTQDTSIDHIWVIRHANLGTEMGRTVSTNSYQTYGVTQRFFDSYSQSYYTYNSTYNPNPTNPTYFPNSYPTQYNNYRNGGYVVYPISVNTYRSQNKWSDNYGIQATCDLQDGTYENDDFYPDIEGWDSGTIETFRKKGNKIYFSTSDSLNGRIRTARWTMNCNNGTITQR